MNIYFKIDGGLGKHVMAIKNKYPKSHLTVIVAYEDVFIHNPQVDEILGHDKMRGLYSKIKDQNNKFFVSDPYTTNSYFTHEKHLIKIWCDMFGLKYQGETPQLFLTQAEIDYYAPFYQTEKPILVIHPHGGPSSQSLQYAWTRDLTKDAVLKVIEEFKNDYTIVQISQDGQHIYPDCLAAQDPYRSIAILLSMAKKRLLIDSSAQHLAKALGLKSTVCWVTTDSKVFGYKENDNIQANTYTRKPDYRNSIFEAHGLTEGIETFPYNNTSEVFDVNKIIESIKNQ